MGRIKRQGKIGLDRGSDELDKMEKDQKGKEVRPSYGQSWMHFLLTLDQYDTRIKRSIRQYFTPSISLRKFGAQWNQYIKFRPMVYYATYLFSD